MSGLEWHNPYVGMRTPSSAHLKPTVEAAGPTCLRSLAG